MFFHENECGVSPQHTFSPTLEEHSDNKDLKTGHGDNHDTLEQREVEDSALSAPDGAKISVLSCTEVLLLSGNGAELAGQLEDTLLQLGDLLRSRTLL